MNRSCSHDINPKGPISCYLTVKWNSLVCFCSLEAAICCISDGGCSRSLVPITSIKASIIYLARVMIRPS
ncbi:hypothetical protein M378DRAFT_763899 [Amanita muscaria Koide BX008]|uniref:Uncharacterized protein n=1 Tax=Amanita muscaria (strain Koide BX008) TaxID=946122 RepID=A0A0C2SZW4_AMAMK|nr:hypothetical protein M378DRAFT_763899 [Amanita muscaria Koide BX008]